MPKADLVQSLLDAIAAADDEATEAAAVACAGRPELLPALRPLLGDDDADRRWWAARTLVLLDSQETVPLLEAALGDPDEAIRCVAAYGLGALRAAVAVPALAARLADASGWVRDSAADGLALIGYPAVSALIDVLAAAPDGARVRAAGALRRIVTPGEHPGPSLDVNSPRGLAIGALFRALQDPNYLVHEHAHEALSHLGLLDNLIVM